MRNEYKIKRGNGAFLITPEEALKLYEEIDNEIFEEVIQKKLENMSIPENRCNQMKEKMKKEYQEQKKLFYEILRNEDRDPGLENQCFVDKNIDFYVKEESEKDISFKFTENGLFAISASGINAPVLFVDYNEIIQAKKGEGFLNFHEPEYTVLSVDKVDRNTKELWNCPDDISLFVIFKILIQDNETGEKKDAYYASEKKEHTRKTYIVSDSGTRKPVFTVNYEDLILAHEENSFPGYRKSDFTVCEINIMNCCLSDEIPTAEDPFIMWNPWNLYKIIIEYNETRETSEVFCMHDPFLEKNSCSCGCTKEEAGTACRDSKQKNQCNHQFEPDHLEIEDNELFVVSEHGKKNPVLIVDYKYILRAKVERIFFDSEEYSVFWVEDLFLPLKGEKHPSSKTQPKAIYIYKITLLNNKDGRKTDVYCTYYKKKKDNCELKESPVPKKTLFDPDHLEMDECGRFFVVMTDGIKKPVCILKQNEADDLPVFMEQFSLVETGQALLSDTLFDVFAGHTDEGVKYYALKVTEETKKKKRIFVKYHDKDLEKLCFVGGEKNSCWIDLRAAEDVVMKKGDFKLISLGVSMRLPKGYEAHIVPRSSTFMNFGIIQTNSFGVIEESYCGNEDVWKFPALAMRDTEIHKGDRICQFRIMKRQDIPDFIELEHLSEESRGGFGSTGIK